MPLPGLAKNQISAAAEVDSSCLSSRVSAKQKGIGFGWCLGGWNELLGALVVADLLYPPPAPRLPLVPSSNAIEAGRR
jgi:hypothetical protein